jgi:hypothetical protein
MNITDAIHIIKQPLTGDGEIILVGVKAAYINTDQGSFAFASWRGVRVALPFPAYKEFPAAMAEVALAAVKRYYNSFEHTTRNYRYHPIAVAADEIDGYIVTVAIVEDE